MLRIYMYIKAPYKFSSRIYKVSCDTQYQSIPEVVLDEGASSRGTETRASARAESAPSLRSTAAVHHHDP